MSSDTKYLLSESYARVEKNTRGKIKPNNPRHFKEIVKNDSFFNEYVSSLAMGLDGDTKNEFVTLAENTRIPLMENSVFQLNPYESMSIPILRVFYPRLIAKELVSVVPMDKPEVIKVFLKAVFKKWNDATAYNFPSINTDISKGPNAGISAVKTGAFATSINLFTAINAGLNSTNARIEKNFKITAIVDNTGRTVTSIVPDVDGNFSATVSVTGTGGPTTGMIIGKIDYLNGTVYVAQTSTFDSFEYQVTASLETNQINPKMTLNQEKIRLVAEDRTISTEWSVQFEQDIKALFDIQAQAEFVNIMADQVALDLDREIINDLIAANTFNAADHVKDFYKVAPTTFTWGQKAWYEQDLVPRLSELSAVVYKDSHMGSANVIAMNPLDAAVFESFNTFEYTGGSDVGGDVGYKTAQVQGGKWKILVSSVVPKGTSPVIYKNDDAKRAVHVFAPYVPAMLTPYPLGATPSLSVLTRYARKTIRPEGIAILNIKEGARP